MKIKPTLLDWRFLEEMAARMTQGADKHPDQPGLPFYMTLSEDDLLDKLGRHTMAELAGSRVDEDGGLNLVAIAANCMMIFTKRAGGKK